jgi:alkanesulfonate monooxygenase SsuD/methylene tetrahydromethanopterin reductase-like flavin-dependent oxidoreductase (luciferase family)
MVLKHPTKNVGTPLSVLDLVMVNADGGSPGQSMQNSLDLARHAERWWGYKRYWLAAHHNTKGIASTATSVFIGFMASCTSTIRVRYALLC